MIKKKIGELQLQIDTKPATSSDDGEESDELEEVGKINTLKQYRDYERRFVGHSNCQTDIKVSPDLHYGHRLFLKNWFFLISKA